MSMPAPTTASPPRADAPGAERRQLDLDVVRGVAIVLALGWHFSRLPSGNAVLDALQWPGRVFGWAGVDLFFVLSGFLVGRLVLQEHQKTGRFRGGRFTVRRVLKLWPVLYLFLGVHALLGDQPWSSYLWQNALHVQNYAGTSLTHLWSLAVEEHFYLALAVVFPLLARRRVSPRVLAGLLGALIVGALALRTVAVAGGIGEVFLQWRTHFRVDALAAGVLLAVVSVHAGDTFDRLLARRWLWAGVTAAGVWFLATVGKEGALGGTLGYSVAWLTGVAFLLLLHRAPWVARARWVSAPLAALGRYSYGIYIWHVFAAESALGALGLGYEAASPAAQVVKYGTAVAAGVAATLVVERPALRLRDRLLHRSGPAPVPTPARRPAPHVPVPTSPGAPGAVPYPILVPPLRALV